MNPQLKLDSETAQAAVQVIHRLQSQGHQAMLVGGCVRDLLLRREPEDYDVATDARPEQVTAIFPKAILVGARFGVVIVQLGDASIEVATFRQETGYSDRRRPDHVEFSDAVHDAKRRDFTINGLYLDVETCETHDYVGGADDLHNSRIRAIGRPADRFQEDALRLLRAPRFASSLSFDLEPATAEAIRQNAALITHVSAERIRDELVKGLTRPNPHRFISALHDLHLLTHILPEVENLVGCPQPPQFHPEGDVFTHTMLVLENLGEKPSPSLAFAALFHDIGKPPTMSVEDRIRFNGHDKVGADMADAICRRLAMSNEMREEIVSMVSRHMQFIDVPQMRESRLKRFLAAATINDELRLHRADCLGSHRDLTTHVYTCKKMAQFQETGVAIAEQPLITGTDLIELGLKPGPAFKVILEAVYDAQLERYFEAREGALDYLRQYLKEAYEQGDNTFPKY